MPTPPPEVSTYTVPWSQLDKCNLCCLLPCVLRLVSTYTDGRGPFDQLVYRCPPWPPFDQGECTAAWNSAPGDPANVDSLVLCKKVTEDGVFGLELNVYGDEVCHVPLIPLCPFTTRCCTVLVADGPDSITYCVYPEYGVSTLPSPFNAPPYPAWQCDPTKAGTVVNRVVVTGPRVCGGDCPGGTSPPPPPPGNGSDGVMSARTPQAAATDCGCGGVNKSALTSSRPGRK